MIKDTVVVDIDGCSNFYPNPLKMWAEISLNLDHAESEKAIEKANDFELLKDTYRNSKMLSYYLPREGAKSTLDKIKERGFCVTLLTSRNPKKNPDIETITEDWLQKHALSYDSIVYTKDKYAHIKENEDRVVMVVEDEPEFLNSFEGLLTNVVVFRNILNKEVVYPDFKTASSWEEVHNLFEQLTEDNK